MKFVLIDTGNCAAWGVSKYSKKGRNNIADCVVELDAERAEESPQVFTRTHMYFIVTGRGLSSDKLTRAIILSAEKYCSTSTMMANITDVTDDFEVDYSV